MSTEYYCEEDIKIDLSGFSVQNLKCGAQHSPQHWHSALEINYCVQGGGTFGVGESDTIMTPGTLNIINPMVAHYFWSHADGYAICVHIEPAVMENFLPGFSKLWFELKAIGDTGPNTVANEIIQLMLELGILEDQKPLGFQLRSQSLLFQLASLLVEHCSNQLPEFKHETVYQDFIRLGPLLQYIQLHHAEEITLQDAANQVGLTREYFCRLFKKNMGTSFVRYLHSVRVIAVAQELRKSDAPISELMERHGFHNQKLFNQMFREIYGCTPTQKRKLLRTTG